MAGEGQLFTGDDLGSIAEMSHPPTTPLGELRCLVAYLHPVMKKKPEWSGMDVGCMAIMSVISRLTDDSLLPVTDAVHAEKCGCATKDSLLVHLVQQSIDMYARDLTERDAAGKRPTETVAGTGQYL